LFDKQRSPVWLAREETLLEHPPHRRATAPAARRTKGGEGCSAARTRISRDGCQRSIKLRPSRSRAVQL